MRLKKDQIVKGDSGREYRVIERISQGPNGTPIGGQADVFKIEPTDSKNQDYRALKVYGNPNVSQRQALFYKEFEILSGLSRNGASPPFYGSVRLHDSMQSDLSLVLEYVDAKDLERVIHKKREGNFSLLETVFVMRRVSKILDDLLKKYDVIHRDVKPQNVLLGPSAALFFQPTSQVNFSSLDNPESIKLCDFSLSLIGGDSHVYELFPKHIFLGTPRYCSPEIMERKTFGTSASDVWALSIMAYDMFSWKGAYPFEMNAHQIYRHNTENKKAPPIKSRTEKRLFGFNRLLYRMRAFNPTERPTMEEVHDSCAKLEKRLLENN